MKKTYLKLVVLLAVFLGTVASADAQRGRTRRANTQKPDTAQKQQVVNSQAPTNYNPYGNARIEVAPAVGGFNDSTKPSLRQDGPFEKPINNRTPLPYENLRADDALFSERVWREIDTREKINQVFRFKAEDDNGDQRFVSIIVKAIKEGKVTAFNPDDDRFTTPLDSASFQKALNGGNKCDTLPVYDLKDPTKIDHYTVTCNTLNPDDVLKFRIKEDWVFDRESSRMFVRIIGIAPLKIIYGVDGKTERGSTPLFWVYYPDMRPIFARYEVYNPKNMGQSRMTWEELLESRMFSSYIVKSTMDNPQNKFIRNYIKDPILALLEGDNIKEKIFNYEQDLWSY
ncbi:MAG: gliding motility protein GldN [Bacteroidota bacterium]|nr:gliding motility protein GldN [Bacteroidota bacterium]